MTQSMALPSEWIDRLFLRFSVMYGAKWAAMWDGVPLADVKDGWATGLSGFSGETIGRALGNCGAFPPTLPEFIDLCKASRMEPMHRDLPRLPHLPNREIPEQARMALERLKAKWKMPA